MAVLILFASIEGQTRKIAQFVEAKVRSAGHEATLVDASDKMAEVTFEGFDTIILAAPVHERRHPPNFEFLLTASRADLAARRTFMISISLGAAFSELKEEAWEYLVARQYARLVRKWVSFGNYSQVNVTAAKRRYLVPFAIVTSRRKGIKGSRIIPATTVSGSPITGSQLPKSDHRP